MASDPDPALATSEMFAPSAPGHVAPSRLGPARPSCKSCSAGEVSGALNRVRPRANALCSSGVMGDPRGERANAAEKSLTEPDLRRASCESWSSAISRSCCPLSTTPPKKVRRLSESSHQNKSSTLGSGKMRSLKAFCTAGNRLGCVLWRVRSCCGVKSLHRSRWGQ